MLQRIGVAIVKTDLMHDPEINWGDELACLGAIACSFATILMLALEFFK